MQIEIKTREDIRSIEQAPFEERNLPDSTFEMLQRAEAKDPDAPALKYFFQAKGEAYKKSEDYTFKELLGNIRQAANMFHKLGIGKEDVVSFLLPNLPETHWTIWGAEAVGIVNPINPLLEAPQIAEIMRAAGTKVLVTLGPFPQTDLWQKVDTIRDQVPTLETVLQVNLADHLTGMPKIMVSLFMAFKSKGKRIKGQKILDFNTLRLKQRDDNLIFDRTILPTDIASYFHTGGTTGTPKLAKHTHKNEVYDSWAMMQFLGGSEGKGKNFFCGLPLFHVNGVFVTGLGPWSIGACITLSPPQGYRSPGLISNFWKIVEHYQLTFFSGVPAVYTNLLNVPVEGYNISSLEFAICGAAPMPVEVFKNFEKKSGVRILEGYGCTEGTCASSVNPPHGERRVGSIGFPFPYQEMKIAILDEAGAFARDAKTDEVGAVVLRGPNVFAGYKEDFHNQNIWVDDGDGNGPWYNTGDLGREDAEGYFWLTGRKKELIIRGGHNIDPKMIEEPMHRHPAIAFCAAIGSPDAKVGEVPIIYVQLKPDMQASPQELYDFAQENIGERAAVPKAIHLITEMPLTAVGKIHKVPLVLMEVEHIFTKELLKLPEVGKAQVHASSDKRHGVLASVKIQPDEGTAAEAAREAASQLLGRFAIHHELEVG